MCKMTSLDLKKKYAKIIDNVYIADSLARILSEELLCEGCMAIADRTNLAVTVSKILTDIKEDITDLKMETIG